MGFNNTQVGELTAPLLTHNVKRNPRGFDYVEAYHVENEANRIFGFDAWDRETELTLIAEQVVDNKHRVYYRAKVRITVRTPDGGQVVREGCGYGSGIDKDLGQAHESALKESESDAEKRALKTFGNPFGQALYDKDKANVADAPPPPSAADAAIHMLDTFGATADGLKACWEQNKAAWRNVMSEADFRRVRDVVTARAAAFKAAAEPKTNGHTPPPKNDFGLAGDEIPQFN